MERKYNKEIDMHTLTRVLYLKAADGKLYEDSAFKTGAGKAEVIEAFEAGVVIKDADGNLYRPISCILSTTKVDLVIAVEDTTGYKLDDVASYTA